MMKIKSVERCFQIIELLSQSPRGLRLSEIGSRLGLNPSTAHHILNTLVPAGYIARDPETKGYALGLRFVEVGQRILDNLDIRRIAHKHLQALHRQCGEAVHLAVLRKRKVVYVDKIDARGGLSLATYVGFATDAHAAAGGKVLLAGLPAESFRSVAAAGPLKAYGRRTITDVDCLATELERVRRQGYAVDDEEYYEGVRCVAAPVHAGGRVVAAVSITGSVFTITQERIAGELKDLVMATAAHISNDLRR
jgi:DNA-binding IclR family transcriptional regulator